MPHLQSKNESLDHHGPSFQIDLHAKNSICLNKFSERSLTCSQEQVEIFTCLLQPCFSVPQQRNLKMFYFGNLSSFLLTKSILPCLVFCLKEYELTAAKNNCTKKGCFTLVWHGLSMAESTVPASEIIAKNTNVEH